MAIGNSVRIGGGFRVVLAVQAICLAASCPPAAAGWREDIGTFTIGIVAEPGSGNGIAGLGTLNDAFANALGIKVEFLVARSYPALIDAQVSARIDYAIYSAAAYAAAYERCGCIEPLVAPTDESGALGIRSVLVTRDGRLPSTSDLAGRRIALLPPDSMAGHQLPLASFSPNGRRLSGEENFFVAAQSAEAAEAMLAEGSVDAIFGWEPAGPAGSGEIEGGTVQRLAAAGVDPAALSVVWRSDVLRYGPHAVSTSLDPEPRERLAGFLTGLRRNDPVLYETLESRHLGGFAAASQADYAPALEIVRSLAGASDQE